MKDNFDKTMQQVAGLTEKNIMTDTYDKMKSAILNDPEVMLADCPDNIVKAAKLLAELRQTLYFTNEYQIIMDKDLRESVLAYGNMLQATKNIFGEENMTENVMIAAIQAASYTAYRNVMGPAAQSVKRF